MTRTATCTLLLGAAWTAAVLADHYHGYEVPYYEAAYVYPDTNTTQLAASGRTRRTFDDAVPSVTASLSFDASIPIPDLDSAVYISVPFTFDDLVSTSRSSSGASGRAFSGGLGDVARESPRSVLYKGLEKGVAHLTGADGHSCLLRAMCEASSTPLHDEGLLGDAVTFLLTANYATEETDARFKKYFAAQAKGQLTGDCSEWFAGCPISLFKFVDDNLV